MDSTDMSKGQKCIKEQEATAEDSTVDQNISNKYTDLLEKFTSPFCKNCPKRKADRVCVNIECGPSNYFSIICGKCHSDVHAKAAKKPEIDLEEFFTKLSTFSNEEANKKKVPSEASIDLKQLEGFYQDSAQIRTTLKELKEKVSNEIENNKTREEVFSILSDSITKALSQCDVQTIHNEFGKIKQFICFEKNKFSSIHPIQKQKRYLNSFESLDVQYNSTRSNVLNSFTGCGIPIDLEQLKLVSCQCLHYEFSLTDIPGKNEVIRVEGTDQSTREAQYYLNYQLDLKKKYKLRFEFTSEPSNYLMIGIMPYSLVQKSWVQQISNENFCKRFLSNSPQHECSRIIQGKDISELPKKGYQVEIRVDFEQNYVDFTDYPNYENINANHEQQKLRNEPYVFAFAFYLSESIEIQSFEELNSIKNC